MAIRERKDRSKPFQVYWNNPFTGKRESRNFATRQEAEKEDSLVKHRMRFERESFRPVEAEEKERVMTLEVAYIAYLKQKKFSRKSLQWQMDAMRLPLTLLGQKAVMEIGKTDVLAVMQRMETLNIKPVTVRNRLSVLRTVLRWCADHDFCPPLQFPKLPAASYEKLMPPTHKEIAAILSVAPPHIARVVIIGSQFGLRIGPSEMFALKWENIDLETRFLSVCGADKNKQAKWRNIPIKASLLPILQSWRDDDAQSGQEYVIHYKGQPVQSIKRAWKTTLINAGISRRIPPYYLRHAFATELIAAGADIGTVARLMGHSSPVMILNHYQYVLDRQKREAIECLPPLPYVPRDMCPK